MGGRKRLFTQTLRGRNISKIDGHGALKSYDGISQNCGEVQSQSRADDSATLLVVENAVDKAVIPNKIYREGHLVADLGWVYIRLRPIQIFCISEPDTDTLKVYLLYLLDT